MNIKAATGNPFRVRTDIVALFVFQGDRRFAWKGSKPPEALLKALRPPLREFKGKKGATSLVYTPEAQGRRHLLVGLGKRADFGPGAFRVAAGAVEKAASGISTRSVVAACPTWRDPGSLGRAFAEGLELAAYNFGEFKSKENGDPASTLRTATLMLSDARTEREVQREVRMGRVLAGSTNLVRDLGNLPGNHLTPTMLANRARQIARRRKLTCQVFTERRIEDLKMGALLGVARGSKEKPRFIIMEAKGKRRGGDTVVLVGKGITFDSGGISLKPSAAMDEMKFDMCGAAAVLGAMDAIGQIGLPFNVVALIPATENLPGGSAQKPGDVATAMSGKTIEVINTDAEGRLILADALCYAARYKPAAIIDLATLTGACIIALGHHAAGLMGSDEKLVKALLKAGETSGERAWQLPLWPEYRKQIDSNVADIKNVGGRPAGTITAGLFLKEFVGDVPWAHIDIAGVAWADHPQGPLQAKGGTGYGVRILLQYLRDRAGK